MTISLTLNTFQHIFSFADYGVLTCQGTPPQRMELNIFEAVSDHPDSEQNKKQPAAKEEHWMSFQKPGELKQNYNRRACQNRMNCAVVLYTFAHFPFSQQNIKK